VADEEGGASVEEVYGEEGGAAGDAVAAVVGRGVGGCWIPILGLLVGGRCVAGFGEKELAAVREKVRALGV